MAIYNPKTKKWEEKPKATSERLVYNPKTKKWVTRSSISSNNQSGYFQKSEGNFIQTVGGTATDVAENSIKGGAGWFEQLIDGLAMLGSAMNYNSQMQAATDEMVFNTFTGNKEAADKTLQRHMDYQKQVENETAKFVDKNLIDEEKIAKQIIDPLESAIGIDTEGRYSVLGDKSDALVQSGTTLLLRKGVSMIPGVGTALALASTGAAVLGAESENAIRQGASFQDAFASGMISAGAEMGSEYLFDGISFGGKTLTKGIVGKIASKIPSKFFSTIAKWGINTAGEGLEEVISGWGAAVGQKLTYASEKEWKELYSNEERWNDFVGGVILGGLFEGVNVASAKNKNIDYVTELSNNERAVLDKVYQDTVAKEQQNGKKLTSKEKTEIFDKVIENMQKGYIPTDSIDSVLGGDAYTKYNDAVSQEEALKNEIKSLKNKKNKTDAEKQRLTEAREQLKAIDKNALKTALDNQIKNTIQKDSQNLSKVKGRESYLSESYRENVRRGQAFEADLNQYQDEYSRQTIKNIMDSGIANNTNLTHEFADMLAKLSAGQKRVFNFTDNKTLKESIFGVDGKTVNGYITKDGITINLNSPKALQTIVGHEISHVLEGTELYGSLQSELKSYLGDAEYNKRLTAIKETYKDIYKGEDAETKFEQELTADLVGDLLFTDKNFVNRLYNNNQDLFQKMFDKVKYLYRVATAGSKQARQLEKIKHTFEEVYKEGAKAQKNTAQEDGVRYSLSQNSESELHKALYDKNYKGEVKLRDESPAIMLAQKGVKNLPMSMKVSHIRENVFTEAEAKKLGLKIDEHTHYHGLGEKFYLKIIDGLDNVKEAYRGTKNADDSSRRENYFLLVSEFVDKDGNTINVPVYIDEHAMVNRVFIDVNKISTTFGRENFRDYINKQIQNKNLVRIKNRSNQTSESNALIARDYGEEASNNSISNSDENVKQKNIFGFSIDENATVNEDLLEELSVFHPEAEVDNQGNVTVYHRTSKESADKIKQSGIMTAKEDALFFSSKENGYASDYGDTVLKFKIPSTVLQVNDIFDGEVHFDIPLKYKNGTFSLDVSKYLVKDDSALQGKRSLSSETDNVAPVKDGIYGKDVLLDDLPIRQTVSKTETVDDAVGDIPIRSDIKPIKSKAESTNGIDDLPIRSDIAQSAFSIKQQLNDSQEQLNKMDVVASYNDPKVFESNQEAVEWVTSRFEGIDYKVNRKGFGEIVLDKKRVKKGMSYLTTNEEKLAFAMVPDVLQKGVEIATHTNHKNRNYGTVTFAAPVELNGERGNMAVVIRQQGENYYKVHRLIMPNGSQFVLDEKRDNAETAGGVENNSGLSPTDNVSNSIIPETEPKVNTDIDDLPIADRWKKKQNGDKVADVLTEEPKTKKKKSRAWMQFKSSFLDKGAVFEDLSLKTKNRELIAKWNSTLYSDTKAQRLIGSGAVGVKALNDIRKSVEDTGKTKEFCEYMYHLHNVDRMSLEAKEKANLMRLEGEMKKLKLLHLKEEQLRAIASEKITKDTSPKRTQLLKTVREYLASKDVKNKPVFGNGVTAQESQSMTELYEKQYPQFKKLSKDVYNYLNNLRKLMVDKGVISQETADLWAKMYPHYVPIRRLVDTGLNISVPLDTRRTGVNAPIKAATGGNRDILPLFDTIAQRTIQTIKAVDRNSFGIELKNTLGSSIANEVASVDDVLDSIDAHEDLLQAGKNNRKPTFTVFENGKKVTFEITEDMYDALKPVSSRLSGTSKALSTMNNIRRGLLTEYNPTFMATNPIKDVQDVLINSQHPARTYANIPEAAKELWQKDGEWYKEYMENGGEQNTYFDKQSNTFDKEKSVLRKILGLPLDKISAANNFIERIPRLAEYIASRKAGASIDVAMLDAARVTTNFAAGGDVTKFLNRNGFTFLNASVQGFNQQWRNIREAKMNGLKGVMALAAKVTLAGLPALLFNSLLWDDDEDYEELSDYVKDNYYVVAKYGDGSFVRIPKGRTAAVIQDAFEQVSNTLTGDDEVDWQNFGKLLMSNIAPNNPLDNNLIAPFAQALENKTWYGEDLVPSRLQDLPAAEQFDESTDAISKWLGETTNTSPYKWNYLIDQYSGGLGDVVLPMLTPEAESGDNSFLGNVIAPMKDKFTTDSVMNNQNVSDFYGTMDELTTNAKKSTATDEDILKSKYMNTVNSGLSGLYKMKRGIQNSSLPDDIKYSQVRELQKQINKMAEGALGNYNDVSIYGNYATVGDVHYKLNDEGEWKKLNDKQVKKLEIFGNVVGGNANYIAYTDELNGIISDKDSSGNTISGSRKKKVVEYINGLNASYGEKIVLFKSQYPSDNTYNYDIVEYLNGRSDLSYSDMETILMELGFKVDSKGNISW